MTVGNGLPVSLSTAGAALCLVLLAGGMSGAPAAEAIQDGVAGVTPAGPCSYKNDPKIIGLLEGLGDNSSATLPRGSKNNPGLRDYSLRMAYAADRQTAFYCGGNHNAGRTNDCWEFHLGSASWYQLHPADGGDHIMLKSYLFRLGDYAKTGKPMTLDGFRGFLDEKQREGLDKTVIPWWKENIVLKDGMLTTGSGGPVMPSHTWDGICYDPVSKRLLWAQGGGGGGSPVLHKMITGEDVSGKMDPSYTPMWTFDPAAKEWIRYRKPKTGPCPDFRGMGHSLVFLPDRKRVIYYIAASNVAPQSYEMWSFDPAKDSWEQLRPNGGKSIAELAKGQLAPPGEQIMRYSEKHGKIVSICGQNTYFYDVARNEWSQVNTDDRIQGHDGMAAFDYDPANDVFLYYAGTRALKNFKLGVFSMKTLKWEGLEPSGGLPRKIYLYGGNYRGYFDVAHNAFVLDGDTLYAYRYKQVPGTPATAK